ncbi:YihY/virulence factor BrkB family protein [Arthrobacter sp. S41]|uniref:YihY/virulence factor BrkB family protein n=2 Tax=Micrococcaceae TaxID=1268 RepID=UPI001035782A|nr:YihY/virulence factor BrkB family protein [Arthrobacter sp. S41]TAP25971.1 YihY/virulence factor BrkB family protein [Arthrobacter sp. S41]
MPSQGKFTKERMKESFSCFPRALREFFRSDGLDVAASLSYFMVLAMFPGLLALVSLLSLAGASESGTKWIMEILEQGLAPNGHKASGDSQQLLDTAEQLLNGLASQASGTFWVILAGSLGALWSTSGYVTAFGRSLNRLYGVPEGRPQWKRRPQMFLITVLIMLVAVVTLVLLVTSGSVARGIGNVFGLGDGFVLMLNIAKPPVMLVMVLLVLALLYYFTPNVKRPKFRWFSAGTLTALVILGLSLVGFGIYLSQFASYSATYGAIGGVIILVLACWISNIALLLGALVDIEFMRLRQLRTGLPAAEEVLLPLRDDALVAKQELANYKDLVQAQEIRIKHGGDPLLDMEVDPQRAAKRKTKLLPMGAVAVAAWVASRARTTKVLRQKQARKDLEQR